MHAGWFDLYRVDRLLQGDVDHEGVTASKDYLNSLVEAELSAGLPPKRIVVGGFSQASATQQYTVLKSRRDIRIWRTL